MRARGEGRIWPRGKVIWLQYQSRRGVQVREPTDPQLTIDSLNWKRKAEKQLRARLGQVAAGVHRDGRALRYEDLREAYMEALECGEEGSKAKSLRRDRAGHIFLEAVRRLDPFFEGYRAVDIDRDLIRKFQKAELERRCANGTVNRSVSCLRRMFTLALEDEKLAHAPYFPMLKESKPCAGTLSANDYPALLAELPAYLQPVLAIGFRTGMRLGEILGLTWQNVNWIDGRSALSRQQERRRERRSF